MRRLNSMARIPSHQRRCFFRVVLFLNWMSTRLFNHHPLWRRYFSSPKMASRATDNLRAYFRKATLPEMLRDLNAPDMPPAGQCSHHVNVQVASEHWRQLLEIRTVEAAWGVSLNAMSISWADLMIPTESLAAEDLDTETGERFTVPCGPTFDIPAYTGRRPTDIMRIVPWLDYLPLITIQRTLHLLFPRDTADWSFSLILNDDDRDRKVYKHFLWSYSGPGKPMAFTPLGDIPRYPLVIAFQPPWILSEQDILEFSECREFPSFSPTDGNVTALEAKERLWCKIWDTCVTSETRWFVLTSYNHWVFGAFSECFIPGVFLSLHPLTFFLDWTIGFVSDVYTFDAHDPSILELLIFWVACAMRLPRRIELPKIREPLTSGPPRVPQRRVDA
ncbi:hypothetical protein B0H12DRAFT_97107 [Mycena haematopus]|nr:hypothetical protein B0H12DRAFT_97107 [Mycena haematopus]